MTPDERPQVAQAALGFRAWRPSLEGLQPLTGQHPWEPGVNQAVCERRNRVAYFYGGYEPTTTPRAHASPDGDCGCGLYAWHELDQLRRNHDGSEVPIVYGAVAGWGRTIVHQDGWRAAKARILALAHASSMPLAVDIMGVIASHYRVPIVPIEMLQLEGARHAESVVAHRPDPRLQFLDELLAYQQIHLGRRVGGGIYFTTTTAARDEDAEAPTPAPAPKSESVAQRHQRRHAGYVPKSQNRPPRRIDPGI